MENDYQVVLDSISRVINESFKILFNTKNVQTFNSRHELILLYADKLNEYKEEIENYSETKGKIEKILYKVEMDFIIKKTKAFDGFAKNRNNKRLISKLWKLIEEFREVDTENFNYLTKEIYDNSLFSMKIKLESTTLKASKELAQKNKIAESINYAKLNIDRNCADIPTYNFLMDQYFNLGDKENYKETLNKVIELNEIPEKKRNYYKSLLANTNDPEWPYC